VCGCPVFAGQARFLNIGEHPHTPPKLARLLSALLSSGSGASTYQVLPPPVPNLIDAWHRQPGRLDELLTGNAALEPLADEPAQLGAGFLECVWRRRLTPHVRQRPCHREDTFLAGLVEPVRIESSGLATSIGEARKNEAVKILYLAAWPDYSAPLEDGVAVRPVGRSLARHLSSEHELRVRGAILPPDSSAEALDEFEVVFMEGGWNSPGEVRFPVELAESFVSRGGQLIVADASRYKYPEQYESLEEAAYLFHASFTVRKVGRKQGVPYLVDPIHQQPFGTSYFTSEMYVDDWLKPALEGIDSILADHAVDLGVFDADFAACGNANTAVFVEGVELKRTPLSPWASVTARGLGHAVLIGADVSNDDLVDICPENARWISNLIAVLTERSRETAGWAAPVQQQKPVDIPDLHRLISDASGAKFASGHYDDAVSAAFKAVEHRVKTLTGSTKSGKPLMTYIFNEQSPTLDIAHDDLDEGQKADETEGFKFLFMGAAQGLRNPRAHGAHLQTDKQEAMEMLATASLLMRALDRAEGRIPTEPA
jgi:uncharacterized protein (TIGR02391 family)